MDRWRVVLVGAYSGLAYIILKVHLESNRKDIINFCFKFSKNILNDYNLLQ